MIGSLKLGVRKVSLGLLLMFQRKNICSTARSSQPSAQLINTFYLECAFVIATDERLNKVSS